MNITHSSSNLLVAKWVAYIKLHEQIKKHSSNICALQLEQYICYKLGLLYVKVEQFSKAKSHMQQALSIHERLADINQTESGDDILNITKDNIYTNLGIIHDLSRVNGSTCIIS